MSSSITYIPQQQTIAGDGMARGLAIFAPKPRPNVTQWLRENITIPQEFSPADAGPWSCASRPYQASILDCWHPDSGTSHCAVSAGVQTAKTFIMVCGVAYRAVNAPFPTLLVGSSREWAKSELGEKRLQPLIDGNACLSELKPANHDRYRAMTMNMRGGVIQIVGGNSPGNLSGGSYGIVAIDEAAKLMRKGSEQAAEAHPIDLALMRTSAFAGSSFHYLSSTPNNSAHPFWQHVLAGTQTRFWVPCPHCREHFFFDFLGTADDVESYGAELGKDLPRDYRSVTWSASAREANGRWSADKVRASVRYICPHNGCEINESERFSMIIGCQERHHNSAGSMQRRSFIIPSFMSPSVTFGALANEFLDAQQGEGFSSLGLQNFYNSRRAIPYDTIKRKVGQEQVLKLRGDSARGVLPSRPKFVFITADPGEHATHWMVTALLDNGELAVIDWGAALSIEEIDSDGFRASRRYPVAGTNEQRSPDFGLVDSRYLPRRVFDLCARAHSKPTCWRYWPSRGAQTRSGVFAQTKVSSHPQLTTYVYSDHNLKSELYGDMVGNARRPGVVLPVDCDVVKQGDGRGLLSGLSGQALIQSGEKESWKRMPHDHYGDTLKLAVLAAAITRGGDGESEEGRVR